jgi:hypothetical protein
LVGTVDWNTRILTGIFEADAASLATPASNFPPTSDLGQLVVIQQGATIAHIYITSTNFYSRQKLSGTWSSWVVAVVRPNYILNSAFQHWQAGTSLGAGSGARYLADQVADVSTGSTSVLSQQAFTLGQTDVDPQAFFFKRSVITSVGGAGNNAFLTFPIESVRTLAGRQVTFSWYAKTAASNPIAVSIVQSFGTGGAPSASVETFIVKVTTTTLWARYSGTVTLPNVNGKTLGTTGDNLSLRIWFDAGSNFNSVTGTLGQQSGTFDIWGVKLEEGPLATPYVVPEYESELLKCQRYYWNSPSQNGIGAGMWGGDITNTLTYLYHYKFPVRMRIPPTVTATAVVTSASFPGAQTTYATNQEGHVLFRTAAATANGQFYSDSIIADARF